MCDQDVVTPRVFLVRHGETEWAKLGRFTGTTDIELTSQGTAQISSSATRLVGAGKLLDPSRLAHIFVSPRKRAVMTLDLLLQPSPSDTDKCKAGVTYTENIAEWDYGDYEGLRDEEIRKSRKERGLDGERKWDIWRDGCEGGESMQQVSERLDNLISQIRNIQKPHMSGGQPADVLIVAHGLSLRCFVKRWLGFSIDFPLHMTMAPGAITVMSYKNNNIEEPTIHIGIALPFAQ